MSVIFLPGPPYLAVEQGSALGWAEPCIQQVLGKCLWSVLWSQSEDSFSWKGLVFLDSPIPSAQDLGCDVGQLALLIIQWTFIEHHLHAKHCPEH